MDAMNSRQQIILQMVIDQGRVSVVDLAKTTGVSEVTIRQDLNLLEKQSYLRRAHGYAVPLDSEDVETRMMNNYALKRELAEFAASLVSNGETVFIENGSSNALLARTLADQKRHYHHRQQLYRAFAQGDALRSDSAGWDLPEKK
jgi:DeoR/GlpR family transcriptional regulator of sugar metabolism